MFEAFLRDSLARWACLVLVLAVVHDAAHRRVGLVRHLHQVEVELLWPIDKGLGQRADAQLFTVGSDQPDLTGPDAFVVAGLVAGRWRSYRRSLLFNGTSFLVGLHRTTRRQNGNGGRREADVRRDREAGPEGGARSVASRIDPDAR